MKKLFIVIAVLIFFYYVPAFLPSIFQIGPLRYNYSICENGFYSQYPKDTVDYGADYYNASGNKVYQIGGFQTAGPHPADEEFLKKVGKCTEVGFWKFVFAKKLNF